MIYIIIGLVVLLLIVRWFTPVRYAVHAGRVGPLPEGVRSEGRWAFGGFVHDEDGHRLDVSSMFIGHATGASMVSHNIPAGATFLGDFLDEGSRATLRHGDIVVIDGSAESSDTGLCLRCVDRIENEEVFFLQDSFGRQPRSRPINELYARVTHVIENGRVGNGEFVASLLNNLKGFFSSKRAA
jgi:hypothetical protein